MNTTEASATEIVAAIEKGELRPEELGDAYAQGEIIVQLDDEMRKTYLAHAKVETIRELLKEGIIEDHEVPRA